MLWKNKFKKLIIEYGQRFVGNGKSVSLSKYYIRSYTMAVYETLKSS